MEETNENMRDERNVMVLFLSNFQLDDINKDKPSDSEGVLPRVFMLKESKPYTITRKNGDKDEEITPSCIQTNEAPIKDVLYNLNGKPLDAVFYLESKAVKGVKKDKNNKEISKESIKIVDSKEDTETQEYDNAIELFFGKRLTSINEEESLKNILKKPLSRDMFHSVEFNEFESDTSKECIEVTLALEEKIREYMENEIGSDGRSLSMKNCNLYVDITGGMRTANMAISAAAQLLQYDGAHLQRMVYSDYNFQKVFDVQPINDLYKLVAGVYAFTNYGRSEALNEYFGDETYEPLHSLRKTMDEFSEAVQLCQEGLFEIKLRKLIEQLEKFPDDANNSAKVKLFRRMIPNMLSEYSSLVSKDEQGNVETDRIEIIRWCVKNKLLQQAMTFCTEWLPEYLVDHGVVYVEDTFLQEYIHRGNKKEDVSDKEYFIKKCITPSKAHDFELDKIYEVPVRNRIKELIDKKIDRSEAYNLLSKKFTDSLMEFLDGIPKNEALYSKSQHNYQLKIIIDRILAEDNINSKSIKKKNVLKKLKELTQDLDWYRNSDFELPRNKKIDMYRKESPMYVDDDQSGNAAKLIETLLSCDIIKTGLTSEEAVDYIEAYTYLRTKLRNKVNHADQGGNISSKNDIVKMTVNSISKYLNDYIDKLELLKDKPKPNFTGLWAEK